MKKMGLSSVYYAHIATGEIHFRALINFKDPADVELFNQLMNEVAILVKKYRGSMSGEHGDGRVRGRFIPFMLGEHNYSILKSIKKSVNYLKGIDSGSVLLKQLSMIQKY